MIYIDDNDPEEVLEPYFCSRDVTIKYNTNARDLYDTIEEIGRGKFGTVYKCKEKATGLKLAAKFIPIPKREDRRNVEREVEIMNSLQHHLIIQLYAAYEYEKMMYVVQELIEGGELFDRVIDEEFVLTEKVCTVFVRQICEAMQFIHSKYILHLDLKPENILCLTKEGNRIKIIDFGLARKYDPDKKLQILFGTPEFVAPEVVNFDCISYGTDMWSVGVICYVLLSGLSPFMGESDLGTMANVTVAKYDFDDEAFNDVSPEALDFISKLLIKELDERMTATEALEHKWLKRPLKPPLSPKPCIIPPIKFKTTTLTLMPFEDNTKDDLNEKELEQSKDNLRTFIERWEEHPNSPYMFETESNLIVPIKDTKADSINSSRACSPSPCESISSITEDQTLQEDLTNPTLTPSSTGSFNFQSQSSYIENLNETENLTPSIYMTAETDNSCANKFNPDFNKYLQSFERRNSDTNYLLGRRSSGEKVNLANEIKKLSEHLLMLAEINNKLIHDTNDSSKERINEEEPEIPTEINESQIMTSNNKNTQKDFKKPTFKGFDKMTTLSNTNSISKNTNNNLSQISFTLNKPSTVTSTVNQNLNKSVNSSSNLSLTKKNMVSTTLPTLKSKEKDYSVTAKIKINSTNEVSDIIKNEHKSPESWNNNERRLSDTQNAALTISKFVQISQGKEKVSQLSSAQNYEQSQQYQKQKQNNNFVSTKKVNTLSERLHQSIDNVPKIAEFVKKPISFSNNLSSLNEFTQLNSKIQNRSEIPSVTFKINKANSSQSKQTLSAATEKLNVYKDSNTSLNKNTETDTASQRRMSSSIASIYQKFSDNNNSETINDLNSLNQTHFRIGVPWAMHTKKRTKFRISETSRDVPISSPNTHQEYNLEEAATQTKDCLLHLLEKYNDTIVKTGSGSGGHNGRHQSISVDRGFSQNLEYQSMSSINTFFQRHAISGGNVKNIQAQLESKNDCTSK